MVYDIGGGTFDVSLLETRDGLLRVVGHDGDNFLGGRDFDAAIVDWLLGRIADSQGVTIARNNPAHSAAIRILRRAAEEAKIELSRNEEAIITPGATVEVDGREVAVEQPINRATLLALCTPIVDRSLEVCRRLMQTHGLSPGQIERVVLVGGPTVAPVVRERVSAQLGAPLATGHDPMTLVAQGAALYAATAGLDGRARKHATVTHLRAVDVEYSAEEHGAEERNLGDGPNPTQLVKAGGVGISVDLGVSDAAGAHAPHQLWLQYPPVSADLTPHIVGRVTSIARTENRSAPPTRIRLLRTDGNWQSLAAPIDEEGGFIATVDLLPRQSNVFAIAAEDASGNNVDIEPAQITIVQGITIGDPPLSRTVGVALANDHVHVYFERGAALPARRTFTHYTVESVAKGADQSVLKIPIVQGEFERAHLCRLIGTLEIVGVEVEASIPSGSPIEVTIGLDRGGRLSASALVPSTGQVFEEVAHLLVPQADPDALREGVLSLRRRVLELRTEAFRNAWTDMLAPLDGVETMLDEAELGVEAASGGDEDAGQKARRTLIELDALVAEAELRRRWPELEEQIVSDLSWSADWVARYGTAAESRLMDDISAAVERAREQGNPGEVERQLRLAKRLGNAAFYRHPQAWVWVFEGAAAEISRASNLPRAQKLVAEGRKAVERGETQALRPICEALWQLLPVDVSQRRLSFDSGVR